MNAINDIFNQRYSCREFETSPLDDEQILSVLEAARVAPSACNKQPWKFYVVRDPEIKAKILCKSRPSFINAPVVIVAVGLHDLAWHRPSDGKDHTDIDLSIAIEHICLEAANIGLGTCWVCSFDTKATSQALGLQDGEEPIALIPLGRCKGGFSGPAKTRKALDEIVKFV